MTILVTGCAGFIGMHVAKRLLERGERVVGLDNLNAYYDVHLKEARLRELDPFEQFHFIKADLADRTALERVFRDTAPGRVVHLAAQAGVRYSLQDPQAYVSSNLVGFVNLLEACRHGRIEHLVYASTSSVYGANVATPFREDDPVDHPVSLYAATKRSNELMAHTYSHLFGLPTTGLRFFTVYGPWGRPDMSMALFTKAILADEPIKVFNHGRMQRDFTYIDDIVEGVVQVLDLVPQVVPSTPPTPTRGLPSARRRSGSTTSATANRSSCSSTSDCSRRRSERRRHSICNPCSPATSWRQPRTRPPSRPPWGSVRRRRSTRASDATSPGIGRTTAHHRRARPTPLGARTQASPVLRRGRRAFGTPRYTRCLLPHGVRSARRAG